MSAATPARRAAYEVLRRTFEHDAWTDRSFPAAAERHGLAGRERRQAQALAYGAVQRRGTSDALLAELAGRDPATLDAPVLAALRLGLYEVLFTQSHAHAAVDGAVELAKRGMGRGGARRAGAAAGLVNAVLRRAARERDELLAGLGDATPEAAAVAHSVPVWLARMWWAELGPDGARSLLRAANKPAETALRVNTARAEPAELLAEMREAGEPARPGGDAPGLPALPEALVWDGPLGDAALAALAEGRLVAQSRGAQCAVALLDPRPGDTVLDLCAGPGIKATHAAARLGGRGSVRAVERDPGRARQIAELAERLGVRGVEVVTADATEGGFGRGYDRVLVDPPCSDLGTLASRPDARWRKDPEAIAELAARQEAILRRGLEALAPGGRLVYSTCTLSERENRAVVAAAGARAERLLDVRPDRDGTDGFFYAVIGTGPA